MKCFLLLTAALCGLTGSLAAQSFDIEAPMPDARQSFAYAEHSGSIYVIGGNDQGGSGATTKDTILAFDGLQWSEVSNLPDGTNGQPAIEGVTGARLVALNGYLYLIGGFVPNGSSSERVFRYSLCEDHWEEVSPMPEHRVNFAAIAMNDKIYVIGGRSWPGWTYHSTVFVYDPSLDYTGSAEAAWSSGIGHPGRHDGFPLGDIQGVGVGGRIFCFGGNSGTGGFSNNYDEIWVYDPDASNQQTAWIDGGSMPGRRADATVSLVYGFIAVAGGHAQWNGAGYTPQDNLWVFSPSNGALLMSLSLPIPMSNHGTGVLDGRLYFFGGNQAGVWGGSSGTATYSIQR